MAIPGLTIVLCGTAGAGKDTVADLLSPLLGLSRFPTVTTRPPRPGEVNGVHYWFVTEAEFERQRDNRELFEPVGHEYQFGLSLINLRQAIHAGSNLLLILLPTSALKLKLQMPEIITVLILSPSAELALDRLKRRGMTDDQIATRLNDQRIAESLPPNPDDFDVTVTNHEGQIHETVASILAHIRNHQAAH